MHLQRAFKTYQHHHRRYPHHLRPAILRRLPHPQAMVLCRENQAMQSTLLHVLIAVYQDVLGL